MLSLPALGSITGNGNFSSYAEVQALAGADVQLPALKQVGGGPVLLEGDEHSGSTLDFRPSPGSFSGDDGLNSFSALQASDDGTVL